MNLLPGRAGRCAALRALQRSGLGVLACAALALAGLAAPPLALHPDNPHYFRFRGRPTVLVGSGEHYGAVLNAKFDFSRYLRTLAADGLNVTRTFSGAYVEPDGAFNIARNTLAPGPGRFLCPWARSDVPGYAHGGNKFDLGRWDPAFFERLRRFVRAAGRAGVVVEMNLFCPFYEESQWRLSPMNAANNINGLGAVERTNVYTLDRNGGLLAVQEQLVRRIVAELNPHDNLYYEICNEPYFGGVTLAWQHHVADLIGATEAGLRRRHLISQNVANGRARVENPHPGVSILNFHYATPPDAVAMNYALGRVIGDNETGFNGTNDVAYRIEAWSFLLAGGGLFNHLDYSFAAGSEDGTFAYPERQPGGGNPTLRRQFAVLARFMRGLPFVAMRPDPGLVEDGLPTGQAAQALVQPERVYAAYVARAAKPDKRNPPPLALHSVRLGLRLPAGQYRAEWTDPVTGAVRRDSAFTHPGGVARLDAPAYIDDIALRIDRLR
jgi:hypothetical protein